MRRALESLLVSIVAAVIYLALAQRTFYGVDGWMLTRRVASGDVRSGMHLLYKPMASGAARVGELCGLTVYESMVALSAIGSAIGIAAIHAGARVLGASGRRAVLVAAAAGALPGVLFFATVVERHGPFFAFVGLTALASAALARRPGSLTGIGFGLTCTLAYAAHSTGVLMLAAFLPLAGAWARLGVASGAPVAWKPILRTVLIAATVTAVGMFVARRLGLWLGTVERESENLAFFLQHAEVHLRQPGALPGCLWNEILTAFAPLSVVWVVAFRDRSPRLVGWAVAIALGVYLLFSFLILGDFDERGAYALPLAWPLAWVTVRRLDERFAVIVVLASFALAVTEVVRHDDRHLDERGRGYLAAAGARTPFLLAADEEDFELLFLYQPEVRSPAGFYDAFDAHGFDAGVVRAGAPALIGYLNAQRSSGMDLLVSQQGLAAMREPADPGKAGPLLLEVLESAFRFEPVRQAGFAGYRLEPIQ